MFVMPEPNSNLGSVGQLVSAMAGPLRDAVAAIEDPNDYDFADTGRPWLSF